MSDRRFTTLRKRLDQLGYRQPLAIEAVPLVEKLFSDLVHTTESFKKYKNKTANIDVAVRCADVEETYRGDNARLVKENNELHLQLIKGNEEIEKLEAELKTSVLKLEHENQDLRFLNTQYVHKIRNIEKESRLKSDQLESLQEHNLKAVVETPGGRRKRIPFRRQRMDMDNTLEPSSRSSVSGDTISVSESCDPYMADLLGVADKRVEELKHQVEDSITEKGRLEKRSKSLQKQVDARDKEINRLNDMLAGGRPVEAVLTDNKRTSGDRVVAHLNIQVDYLQQVNRDLEKKLTSNEHTQSQAAIAIQTLQDRNDELCLELSTMDKLYTNLNKEKMNAAEEVDEEINILKEEVEEKHQNLLDLQSNNYNLKKERDEVIEETERLNFHLHSGKEEKRNLAELYERCDKERRKLQEKNARLTVTERELVMDLERLKISKGILPKKTKGPDRVENLIRNMEDDRDYYKKECDMLLNVVHKKIFGKGESMNDEKADASGVAQILKEERDYYRREYELLRTKGGELHSPPTSDKIPVGSNIETARLTRERDELQKLLATFEKHLTQIQENVSTLSLEKNNVEMLYEQASEEIHRLRRQVSRGVPPGQASQKITSILEKAEKERDEALTELRKARQNIQGLRDDIKAIQKDHLAESKSHNIKQQELSDCIEKMEVDRGTLNLKIAESENIIQALEEKLTSASNQISLCKEDRSEKELEFSKMRVLLEQGENTHKELAKKVEETVTQMEVENREKEEVKEKLGVQKRSIEELNKEIGKLKNAVTTLDKEKDALHMQIDEKTENLVKLDSGLREQQEEDVQLKKSFDELEENLRHREQELLSKNKEIASLTKQVRSMERELDGLGKARNATMKENKRIQDDLAMMTKENQKIHKNLKSSEEQVQLFKDQVEDYALQISRIEDLLAQKELEKAELLLQYKTLSSKADILQNNMAVNEDNAVNIKQELLHKQQEIIYLHDRCAALEGEIEQHISTEESYESQISSLTKSLANIETQLRKSNEDKENITQDLYSVRELCVKLDQTREDLTKTTSVEKQENEKLERKLTEQEAECEYLRSQVEQEKETVKSLENLITAAREKEFYEMRLHEEGYQELEKTTEELSKTEKDRNIKNVENANLRLQILTLQEELTSLRKQLTSEKFERERLKQEFRRNNQAAFAAALETAKGDGGVPADDAVASQNLNAESSPCGIKESVPYSSVRPASKLNETFYSELNVSSSDADAST